MNTETLIALHLLSAAFAFMLGYLLSELRHAKREHQRITENIESDKQRV